MEKTSVLLAKENFITISIKQVYEMLLQNSSY